MSTELLWKTCDLYAKIYQSLWNPPAVYNPKTHRLKYFKNPREYRTWSLILYSASAVNFCFYFLFAVRVYRLILAEQSVPILMVATSFLGFIVVVIDFVAVLLVKHLETACTVLNEGEQIERSFMRIQPNSKSHMKKDYLGMSLYAVVAFSSLIPVTYSLTESTTKFLVFELMPRKSDFKILAFAIIMLRKVFLCFMSFEVCRIIFGLLIGMILCVEGSYFLINQYRLIGEKAIEKSSSLLVNYSVNSYNSIVMLLGVSEQIIALLVLAFMSGGLAVFVICNTITLKMHVVIPKPFYYFFPSASVITILMISFTLPQAVKVYDLSLSLVRVWNLKAGLIPGNNSRSLYVRKRMKALRPINIPAGIRTFNLFWINKSIKTSYYQVLGDFTLNLLLGTPKFGNK